MRALLAPGAYAHPVREVRRVETHISWVFLTGVWAYKVKKPLKLGFLDFSTLARRRAACAEELRLNRRLAPDLYLDVVPIARTAAGLRVGARGPIVDYAVRMREFSQDDRADRRLAAGRLEADELEALARRLAEFHRDAPPASPDGPYGDPARLHAAVLDTLDELARRARGDAERAPLAPLRAWCEARFAALGPVLAARRCDGRVREGHGDLHLGNLVWRDGALTPFDGIEFNADLRWIDVVNDIAFLVMDLVFRGRADLAYRFVDAWLEATGDYDAVRALRYGVVYRALVRAKVAAIRRDAGGGDADTASIRAHVDLARAWVQAAAPRLLLMHGVAGSGKTRLSAELVARLPAVRIRSDVERKRLHGLAPSARTGAPLAAGLYSAAADERTYARLAACAEAVLEGGETAIVDATFLRRAQRDRFRALARRLDAPMAIVSCTAPRAELERRVVERHCAGTDASEADVEVLAHQRASGEPLDADERARAVSVETSAPVALPSVLRDLDLKLSATPRAAPGIRR